MGRKSVIDQVKPEVRERIMRHLRANRLTLREIIADLQAEFPGEAAAGDLPSQSSLQRYAPSVREIVKREREMSVAAEALVAELGEDFDAKSGALLAQAVTTLASRTALHHVEKDAPMEIGDILDLARAAKVAQEARSLNLRERQQVAKTAREKLLEEQRAKLDAMGAKAGVTEETKRAIREALGIL